MRWNFETESAYFTAQKKKLVIFLRGHIENFSNLCWWNFYNFSSHIKGGGANMADRV